jgi:hypothetical protein
MGALRNPFLSYVEEWQMHDLPPFDAYEPLMPYYRFKNPSIPARAPGKARFSTMAREAMT